MNNTVYTWQELGDLVRTISQKIINSEFKPDIIVAVSRGGFIPDRLVSDYIGVKKITCIGLTYTDTHRTNLQLYCYPKMTQDLQSILIIEDQLESGKALSMAIETLSSDVKTIRSLAFFVSQSSIIIPLLLQREVRQSVAGAGRLLGGRPG